MKDSGQPKKSPEGKSGNFVDGLKLFVFIVLVAFLAFVAGGVTTNMKVAGVGDFMQRLAMVSYYLYESTTDPATFDPFWNPAHMPGPKDQNPVVLNDSAETGPGYNLVVDTHAQEATLIDMNGKTVHKWARRFTEVWSKAPQLKDYGDYDANYWSDKIYWRRAHLYPNGDILVIYETPYRTPYGLGLAKLDKDSNVIWKLDENVHHDLSVAPDGDIYLLGHFVNEKGYKDYPELKPPFIDDTVLIVSSNGSAKKKISIVEAFKNSQYAPFLDFLNTNLLGDVMHTNTVQYLDADTAAHFAFAKAGDILLSMREMNVIAVLDPDKQQIVWAQTGLWRGQHEPVMMTNGRILMFDNKGHRGLGGGSRVIEYDPVKGSIDWSYTGTASQPLQSPVYGSVQRLPDDHTLIVESTDGRAFEVTPEGKVVWDYRSPYRKSENGEELVMPLMDVVRFAPGTLNFVE